MYDGMVYLMVSIVAMQFYLFGVAYVYKLTGTLDMTAAAQALAQLDNSSLMLPFALIMTAVCLKCALMPLFSWFPKAYTPSTPSVATAILSGVHAKVGIYLFIRFHSLFAEVMITEFFLIIGVVTGIAGAVLALSQTDVRLILAYSTISQIGLIMVGLCVSDIHFYTGGVYHIFNHALFKSALFMCAGIISQAYGTRDITQIRGVLRRHPYVAVASIMAILGIIGTPFFNGSISKYFISAGANWLVERLVLLINLGTITIFIRYSTMLFGRPKEDHASGKTDLCKQAAIYTLGALCLAGGIFGEQFVEFLFNVRVNVDSAGYLEKTGLFALSVVVGYLLFRFFVDRHPFFKRIRGIDMNFRWICASMGGFFAVTLIVVRFFA
jgi:multicomponent Na+:H+ antiporter subunit D